MELETFLIKNNGKEEKNHDIKFKGIPSSPGISFGKAVVLNLEIVISPLEKIEENQIENEIDRFLEAKQVIINEFNDVISKIDNSNKSVLAILETNLFLISDPFLEESIINRIKNCYSAESSIITEIENQNQFLKSSKDQILKERSIELDQIKERLISVIKNQSLNFEVNKDSIIVSQSISPTDLIKLQNIGICGLITEIGGMSSHTSILARNYEIPEVIGLSDATSYIPDGSNLIIDGYSGTIIINPSDEEIEKFHIRKSQEEEHKRKLGTLVKLPSETKDNHQIKILANVDFPNDINHAILVGAEGIGLVRTEHLILSKMLIPDEEEQFKYYNELAERAYPNFVTIRAFDLGSDKFAEGITKHESNPALGFRGIRFLLQRKDVYKSQLRAILRASKNKNIKFMIPMIARLSEILATKSLLEECKSELDNEGLTYDLKIPIGIMIETPSAAVMSDILGQYVDFFSIGTNDLTQYTLAADRTNELVSEIYDSFHPSILRLIKMIADGAHKNKIPVSICGEMASHSAATALLIGFGINELSVSPSALLELKSRIRSVTYLEAKSLANNILDISLYDYVRKELGLNK